MDTSKVTRVNVIDHTKSYSGEGCSVVYTFPPRSSAKVEVTLQDDGRTLKVWITDRDRS